MGWPGNDPAYDKAVAVNRRKMAAAGGSEIDAVELIRFATLAANSHNTQPWLFNAQGATIQIKLDVSRRCPVVDPEDRHLVASLGCATENLALAAAAAGFKAVVAFEGAERTAIISVERSQAQSSPAFEAITRRQSTRAPFNPAPLPAEDLRALEIAIGKPGIRARFLTARRDLDQLKDFVIQGNTVQCHDPVFVDELRHWVRFDQTDAAETSDGLYAGASGNPALPRWLGRVLLPYVFTPAGENPKYVAQIDGSAGALILYAEADEPAGWFNAKYRTAKALDALHDMIKCPAPADTTRTTHMRRA